MIVLPVMEPHAGIIWSRPSGDPVFVEALADDAVELFDTVANATVTIPKTSIDETHEVGSPMPEGLTAGMPRVEVRDLIRYLIELKPR